LALVISQIINDYRRCKSLLDNILLLLNLAGQFIKRPINEIPLPLLALAPLLPGTSPARASINAIAGLQALGIPTGTLPDGSPNLMLLYNLVTNQALDQEESENGKVEVVMQIPSGVPGGGLIPIAGFGKKL